jgi:hypothetical protein
VVKWNGVALATVYGSSTSLTATVPSAYVAGLVSTHITVTTPAPGGGTSAGVPISVVNPVPTATSVSPNTIPAGSTTPAITVTGTQFLHTSVVKWNGVALATAYVSPTSLTATIPSAYVAGLVTTNITVTAPAPGGGTSTGVPISVVNPVPTATSVSPNTITADSTNPIITVTGTSFEHNSVVKWNGAALVTVYVSPTSLTATIPSAYIAGPVSTHITVTTPAPGGGTSAGVPITVTP